MDDSEFHQLADQLMQTVEEHINAHQGEAEISCSTQGTVMTLGFESGQDIVIDRQAPLHQVRLTTKASSYHFDYQEGNWICNRSGFDFWQLLKEACCTESGEKFEF